MAALRTFWWREQPNFGDALTALLVPRLFGRDVTWSPLDEAELLGIGSTLGWLNELAPLRHPMRVWTSGFMYGGDRLPADPHLSVHAVRGPRSRSQAGLPAATTMGDGALLCARAVPRPRSVRRGAGIVPHLHHQRHPLVAMLATQGATVIDVRGDPLRVVERIASCEMVFSSSLHGLVVADSYGIPNAQLRLPGRALEGDDHKFADHRALFEIAPTIAVDVTPETTLDMLRTVAESHAGRPGLDEVCSRLVGAFPS